MDFGLDEFIEVKDIAICDWCGISQRVKQSFDLRRMLCADQNSCLSRVPPSAKNHFMGGKNIITFPCVIPHCEGKSIRQGSFCTKHISYTDAGLRASPAPHGSVRRYKGGCPCTKCKRANAEYKILLKELNSFLSYNNESIIIEDLENWIRHILDILYSGAPGKKVIKILDEENKIKYVITDIEVKDLDDELLENPAGHSTDSGGRDGQGGASDEPPEGESS